MQQRIIHSFSCYILFCCLIGGFALVGCTEQQTATVVPPVQQIWQYTSEAFWDKPWPDDSRMKQFSLAEDLLRFPNPSQLNVLEDYLAAIAQIVALPGYGFSTNGAIYLPFDNPINEPDWPSALATTQLDSPIQLINISKNSDNCGNRIPIEIKWARWGDTYLPPNTLIAMPAAGFPLESNTQYALVVDRSIVSESGRLLQPNAAWRHWVLQQDTALTQRCDDNTSILSEDDFLRTIVAGTLFTTGDPQLFIREGHKVLQTSTIDFAAPDTSQALGTQCTEYSGWITLPQFQVGQKPYLLEGGYPRFDTGQQPVAQSFEAVRYTLALPSDYPANATDFPWMIYAHGTGGDRRTVIRNGIATDVCQKMAVFAISQPLHGLRRAQPNDDPTFLSFNFLNLRSLVFTFLQGGLDLIALNNNLRGQSIQVQFDGYPEALTLQEKAIFMGHSQGALAGAFSVAADSENLHGAVFSGSSGHFIHVILDKTEPIAFAPIIEALLSHFGSMTKYSPILSLFQLVADPADPINYAPYYLQHPLDKSSGAAWSPIHLFISEGIYDAYTPPSSTEAFIIASSVDRVDLPIKPVPLFEDLVVAKKRLQLKRPATGNHTVLGRQVSAWTIQYPSGHYSLLDTQQGKQDLNAFLIDLAEARIPVTPLEATP